MSSVTTTQAPLCVKYLTNEHTIHSLFHTTTHYSNGMDTTYQKAQIIDALVNEWIYLCHDDPDPDDMTPEEYRQELINMSYDQLVEETSTDEHYTLDEYMDHYG